MMQFWTYMLQCADGSYYVGHTDDLERRLPCIKTEVSAAIRLLADR